ncbi:hypothetical protein, partial [Pseudomonas silesiensis]|uniref:hypothetical protein n=1 Tax=Pseudomonas silesiensis TaxID=1853130 RepID=UPI0034D4B4CB
FLDLTDTPSTYAGQAGNAVAVNNTEDGLEFVSFPEPAPSTFPLDTPNVNVAVGGWFAGYVLAGKEVIDTLIDLGVQFINP